MIKPTIESLSKLFPRAITIALGCSLINGMASSVLAIDSSHSLPKTSINRSKAKNTSRQVTKVVAKKNIVRLHIDVPCRAWTPPKGMPKVVLLCVHGLGLNSGSFEQFGRQMAKLGVATYAVDVRGFGTWMKMEGKEEVNFPACLTDVEAAVKVLHTAYPKLPLYILGESMGGAIALRITAEHPELVDGLISAVPSGDRFHKTRNELRVALRVMTGRRNTPMEVGSKVINDATDDPAVRERWRDDPLNRMQLTPTELRQFQSFMSDNHDVARQIDTKPVLMIAGFKDKLVRPQGTIDLFNELSTPDKMLIVVGNGEHLIFEENQMTEQVSAVLYGWLTSHINHKSTSYITSKTELH